MIRKPSFASLLVSGPSQLKPFHASGSTVAMPTAPPAGLRYGSLPPGIAQSSRFTGGVVQHQPAGQVFTPPNFISPTYSTPNFLGAQEPSGLSSLIAARLGVRRPVSSGPTPSTPSTPNNPVAGSPIAGNTSGGGSPTGAPGSSGGFHQVRSGLSGVLGGYGGTYSPYNPQPNVGTPASVGNPTGGYTGGYVPLGAALAAAAVAGRRGTYYE